jgi:hypothetical protein
MNMTPRDPELLWPLWKRKMSCLYRQSNHDPPTTKNVAQSPYRLRNPA